MQRLKVITPLQSWDIFSEYMVDRANQNRKLDDQNQLNLFKTNYKWDFDTEVILDEDYTALVITDATQTIQWVNTGFGEMTGYSRNFAIGKHPRFLQGKETSAETKASIKTTLELHKPVSKQLLNYKKDGSPYICDIKIIPLFNTERELTHFMALEKKARVA